MFMYSAKPIIIGHRGAKGHEPENTLLSIEKGISLGADWIEVDVHLVQGRLMVIHDPRLERTTNGVGSVADQSIDYLRSLNAGKGEKIPFLEEVFDLIDKRTGLNIELKDELGAPAVASVIQSYIRNHGWSYDKLIVCSFLHAQLARIKKIIPELRTGALIIGTPQSLAQCAQDIGAYAINPSHEYMTQSLIDDAHQRDLQVYTFTINTADDAKRICAMGVDGIITDYPDIVRDLVV
jgi:glycerophosphoryl diester phosphodiesterase